VKHAYDNVPLYRKKLDEAGVKPEDIKSLKDLAKLPFTVKDDFRDYYPDGLFAVPRREIVRVHASSGTTGKPTVVGYTKNDLKTWAELVSRIIVASDVTSEDTAQISFGYGLFTGALGLHYGLENIGATVIPMSSGNTDKQLMLMEDLGTTVLIATPSYAMYMSEIVRERGLRDRLKLRIGLLGSEGCTEEMRKRIEENFGIMVTDNYGLSEVIGPGVSGECTRRSGMHIAEDHFICEIINPETGEVLPEGEEGELVVTSLTKEALPVLRYRTRDLSRITYEPCACGRTSARMEKIKGRSDDMLIVKGVNVFPSQIESVLVGMNHIGPHYLLTVRSEGFMDSLEVSVELIDGSILERYSELERVRNSVHDRLRSVLGLDAKVTLVAPKTIERFQGKAKRVIDLRNK
jgi:phenylacetate-CoA ligase